MREIRELTKAQEILLGKVGLFHTDWLLLYEDKEYLHIVKKEKSPAEIKIIDKKNKKVL